MRIIEILLKLAYLALFVYFLAAGISHESITAFLVISGLLGVTLLVNTKHPSYTYPANYPRNNRVILMRRIEGVLMILFAAVVAYTAFI